MRSYSFNWTEVAGRTVKALFADDMGDLADWTQVNTSDSGTNIHKARVGDEAYVARSDAMLDLIEAASPMADCRPMTIDSVAGAFPNVAAYLAGSPMNMRLRKRQEAHAPLNIVVDLGVNAMFGDDHRARRGAAVLALLRKLETAGHAVDLYFGLGCGNHARQNSCILVHVDTRPLDLIRSAYALGSRQYMQQTFLCIGAAMWGERGETYGNYPIPSWTNDPIHAETFYAHAMASTGKRLMVIPPAGQQALGDFANDAAAVRWVNQAYARAVAQTMQDA